jgi:hypothetical protein
MWRRVALVRSEVSEELISSNISSLILFNLMMQELCSSEISVLARVTGHQISEDGILQVKQVYWSRVSHRAHQRRVVCQLRRCCCSPAQSRPTSDMQIYNKTSYPFLDVSVFGSKLTITKTVFIKYISRDQVVAEVQIHHNFGRIFILVKVRFLLWGKKRRIHQRESNSDTSVSQRLQLWKYEYV